MSTDEDKLAQRIRDHFFTHFDEEKVFELFDGVLTKLPEPQRAIAQAFRHNLVAAAGVVLLPFTLATFQSSRTNVQEHLTAKLEELDAQGLSPEAFKESKVDIATDFILRFLHRDTSHIPAFLESMLAPVDGLDGYDRTLRELLRQGAVLIWGALEVLVMDSYRLWSGKDDTGPKGALQAMIPYYPSGQDCMEDLELWRLFQSRHLIVHRHSIVDGDFLKETKLDLPLSSELIVTSHDVAVYFDIVIMTALSVLLLSSEPPVVKPTSSMQ